MPLPQPTVTLTADQLAFYRDHGYLVLDSITTPAELEILRDAYDRIFTAQAGRDLGNQFDLAGTDEEGAEAVLPQILGFQQYAPEFLDSLMMANAGAIAKQLCGDDAASGGGHAIYKPPKVGAATPWHQDESYWSPAFDYRSLSIWVPLQEATVENGCMHFVPGSHKLDVLPHQSINNDPRIHGLELQPDAYSEVKNPVACPLPPGGCTIHDARTLHYAPANKSDIPRRAVIFTGGAPGTPRDTPYDRPWQDEKKTARMTRAELASAANATTAKKDEKSDAKANRPYHDKA